MNYSDGLRNPRSSIIICVIVLAFASLTFASNAPSVSTSVNIVNNSNREIRNVYLSSVNANDWSGNQLGESTISPGQSYNLNIADCSQSQKKVIGEDQDGCFVSTVVNCGSSATWTITNDTARDCGY